MRPREVYPLLMRPIVAERNSTVIHHLRKSKIFPTSIDRFVLFCCSWKFLLSRLIPPSLAFASKLGSSLARPNISEMTYLKRGGQPRPVGPAWFSLKMTLLCLEDVDYLIRWSCKERYSSVPEQIVTASFLLLTPRFTAIIMIYV